jgi:hypothetical protein
MEPLGLRGAMMRLITIFAVFLIAIARPGYAAEPTVMNAEDGIFSAFRSHPLVGIRDAHGWAQQEDFYSAVLRDPRFAREVGNVVLETGNAAYQNVVDRYVNGEKVPYAEMRKVWADTIGFSPTVFSMGFINVYATIRSVNLSLPMDQRIKVWLGDPPTDWSKITTKQDMKAPGEQRESYPAELITREILAKNKKALAIYGFDHLRLGLFSDKQNLLARINATHPGAFFIVSPYIGYATKDCAAAFERHIQDWPTPALIMAFRGSPLENDMARPGCGPEPRPSSMTESQFDQLMQDYTGLTSDALLYLGPREQQVCSPASPDIYLDLDFRAELERRKQIRSNKPFTGFTAHENTATPRPFWPTGQCLFQP